MRGDHLTIRMSGTYYHHGIDCGDGTVIHMSKKHNGIRRSSYGAFSEGKAVYREDSPMFFDRDEVVRRAERRLGEQGYDLISNNCEHFATWCRTGSARCAQWGKFRGAAVKAGTKALVKSGAKTGSRMLAKSGAKVSSKTLAKGAGAFMMADGAQLVVEQFGGELGLSQSEAKVAGQTVGLGTSIGIGVSLGGPVGGMVAAGIWGVGEVFGSLFD